MREHSTGGRIAAAGLLAALVGGLLWAPAAAASETPSAVGDTGTTTVPVVDPVVVPADRPETGSSWTLRRTVVDGASLPATTPGAAFGSVDTGLPDGSSWT